MMQIPFLIDCGEGTQLQLKKYKIKAQKIDHVFISHLHGDHYYGLMGLISSLHLYGRSKELYIYGPPGLGEIITINLKHSQTALNYKIVLKEWTPNVSELLFENINLTVHSFPLNHRINCSGFVFREKPKKRRLRPTDELTKLTPTQIMALKNGLDIVDAQNNVIYENKIMTLPPAHSCSYAYCSDTKYDESILPYIQGVDLLYHESTFMMDMEERAAYTFHSTTHDAGKMALLAEVKKLIIGHFSTRYKELEPLLEETKTIFENAELALEGIDFIEG